MSSDESTLPLGISDADRERIREILQTRQEMSPETCARVRQRVRDGDTSVEISVDDEIQWSEATVRYHARGKCSHDIDSQPIDDIPRHTHPPLTAEECAHIRRQRDAGMEIATIANEMGCGTSTVDTHANGRCSHESVENDGGEQA